MKKHWYHSKTIWVNIGAIVVIILVNLGMGEVSQQLAIAEGSILGVINLVLRLTTNQGLTK